MDQSFDPELIIGLVGAVGTEIKVVVELLEERLRLAGYETEKIKISEQVIPLVPEACGAYDASDAFQRIKALMDGGNAVRRLANDNGVLADGVATLIYDGRAKDKDGRSIPNVRKAYIVDSLKRPEEVGRLRSVYPNGFVLIGIHSEENQRLENLVNNLGISPENAKTLISRDGEEQKVPNGQRLNKTFHLADFFVRLTGNRERLRHDIRRMIEIWFGYPYHTPTFDEYAMFMAFSAALRSADLSRQVGAVIARNEMILATGANDCPRFGGGLYWPAPDNQGAIGDIDRGRDYKRESDSNRIEQLRMIEDISSKFSELGVPAEKAKEILESSRLRDLTEFGRVVHAEMEALLACGRLGISTVDSTLYSTTFPCHNCAKHIVAAGIKRVVYVEPYPKSKAIDFHDDSISTSTIPEAGKVQFQPFVGIGPRRYFDLFSINGNNSYPLDRKDPMTGKSVKWAIERAKLRIKMAPDSYLGFELQATNKFSQFIKKGQPS
jgi:cytidine deaminase